MVCFPGWGNWASVGLTVQQCQQLRRVSIDFIGPPLLSSVLRLFLDPQISHCCKLRHYPQLYTLCSYLPRSSIITTVFVGNFNILNTCSVVKLLGEDQPSIFARRAAGSLGMEWRTTGLGQESCDRSDRKSGQPRQVLLST